jgi:hypothetical protein
VFGALFCQLIIGTPRNSLGADEIFCQLISVAFFRHRQFSSNEKVTATELEVGLSFHEVF